MTETLVSSLTSLHNFCSIPVAVDYTPQAGKTRPCMAELSRNTSRLYKYASPARKRRLVDVTLVPFPNPFVAASVKNATSPKMSVTNANRWDRSVTCLPCLPPIIVKEEI